MPAQPSDDRLLFVTRIMLALILGLLALAFVAVAVAIPILAVARDRFMARAAESNIPAEAFPWILLLMALIAAGLALGFLFIRNLQRIVGTVSEGDPFVPANADRLQAMAWLALGLQGLALLATPLIIWFDSMPHKANVHHDSEGISLGALVLALLLFVLARVFRVGSAMRADLEGTV